MPKGDFFEKLRRNKILGLAYRGYKKSVDEQTKEDLINLSDNLSQKFSQTSKLGKLKIDERNSLFSIYDSNIKNGLTLPFSDVDDISITTTNINNKDNKNVFADIQMDIISEKHNIRTHFIIKPHVKCRAEKQSGGRFLDFSEPGDVSVIRSIINQCMTNNIQKEMGAWKSALNTEKEYKIIEAEIAFILPNNYTKEMVYERYLMLKNAFESISDKEPECLKRINRYYQVLMSDNNKYLIENENQ